MNECSINVQVLSRFFDIKFVKSDKCVFFYIKSSLHSMALQQLMFRMHSSVSSHMKKPIWLFRKVTHLSSSILASAIVILFILSILYRVV